MILQYKGFKNNWCYEEAETITWANVSLHPVTSLYRYKCESPEKNLERVGKCHNSVVEYIQKETGYRDENITFLVGNKQTHELGNVCVVILVDKNKYSCYVFENGVYMLSNSGSTIQRIA